MTATTDSFRSRIAVALILLLAVFGLAYRTLGSQTIEGLDAAHTIMDGFYFRDLIVDRPLNPIPYTLNYYRQYPALGFLFWPPFFPFVLGIGFLTAGLDIRVAHLCLFAFSFLLVWMVYLIARRTLTRTVSVIAALLVITTPIVGEQSIILMREIPALALTFATVYAYLRFIDSPRWKSAILFSLAGIAALYTKQTVVFIYPVLALDLALNHRALLRDRRLWTAVGIFILAAAPLAVFTIGFSRVNVEQSLGSDRSFILGSTSPARWTLDAWTFYPRALITLVNPLLVVLGASALVYGFRRREFFRENTIWFGWVLIWVALFTCILNKQARHAILWLPGWCMLAVIFAAQLRKWSTRWKHVHWVFIIPIVLGAREISHYRPPEYGGLSAIVDTVLNSAPDRNLMYFGRNRQAFIPFIRMKDTTRRIFTIQGDDITSAMPIRDACREYRVAYILAERGDADFERVRSDIDGSSEFVEDKTVQVNTNWRTPIQMQLIRYRGPSAPYMKTIPLHSRLVTQRADSAANK